MALLLNPKSTAANNGTGNDKPRIMRGMQKKMRKEPMSIKRLFTIPEIIEQFDSGEYSAELLLQHAMKYMKTNNEKRFEAAKAAMQGLIIALRGKLNFPDAEDIARMATNHADTLLAELARTEPAEHHIPDATKMVPDADGWVVRIPTDPIPEKHNGVRFGDGEEELCPNFEWVPRRWRHEYTDGMDDHITHYRPA